MDNKHKLTSNEKVIMMVGKTGSGKSTIGNVLLGAEPPHVTPFTVNDSASGVTTCFSVQSVHGITVVDTVGFGDPNFQHDDIVDEIQKAVTLLSSHLNIVFMVVKKDRITEETAAIFKFIVEDLFMGDFKDNVALCITNCDDPNWPENNRKDNKTLDGMLKACRLGYLCLDLPAVSSNARKEQANVGIREEEASKLISFVAELNPPKCTLRIANMNKGDLDQHIQSQLGVLAKAGHAIDKWWLANCTIQ